MFYRITNPLLSRSFFLFGARGTGKSTYLKHQFAEKAICFNLLDPVVEEKLALRPNSLKEEVLGAHDCDWVIIDEIQKLPKLLDVVHDLIESTQLKFVLTGSSARKLKAGSANLLAGRAFVNYMFPLTSLELGKKFNLNDCLNWGSLPEIYHLSSVQEKQEYLRSYALSYLKEEIWGEHIIRKLDPFRKFLEIAAQLNCEIINFSNIAKDIGVDVKTVQSYYQILEDTLLGFMLESYHTSIRKQQRKTPKFYLFDLGVAKALTHSLTQSVLPNTYGYGKAFEHWIVSEIYRLNLYYKKDYKLSYLLTKDNAEIDLIIERPGKTTLLIEIKSVALVDERALRHLRNFATDIKNAEPLVLSQDTSKKKIENIVCLFWQDGISYIFL